MTKSFKDCHLRLTLNSQRACDRFNQVVEAKRFEGVFFKKNVLNSKIKLWLKNWLVHKNAKCNGIPLGYAISQNSVKMEVPLQVYTLNRVNSVVNCIL